MRARPTAAIAFALAPLLAGHAHGEGDPARGSRVFQRCYSCHSVDPSEQNLQGPNLAGIVGRPAGTLARFEYSDAMIAAGRNGLVWTEEKLDVFVVDPQAVVPGTAMAPVPLNNPADRADLVAYLKRASR
jgi:cytochrome c